MRISTNRTYDIVVREKKDIYIFFFLNEDWIFFLRKDT